MSYFIYIIECDNGSLYTGYTTDVEKRYDDHVTGKGRCKYTRSFPPKRLLASWQVGEDLSAALKLERAVKRLKSTKKWQLAELTKLSLANALESISD